MNHFEAFESNKTGKKLMFADDMVIDVSHFLFAHPGGAYMIQNSIGEDIGKYMVGCSSYGGSFNPYQHSNKAFSIVKSLAIAKIPYPQGYLKPQDSSVDNASMEFDVLEKLALNKHTSVIYLKSDYFKMASACEQISWLGKHFKVSYRNRFTIVSRYYSAIFIDLNEWGTELGIISDQMNFHVLGLVKLIFKVYAGGKMTSYLNDLRKGEQITMQGPIGPGLMIHELTGNCLAFAGGTGLVPFLDLVYLASKNENLSAFHLTLFVSFKTFQDGFALEVLEAVKKRPNADWLNLIIMTDQHPDKKRIPELVKEMLQNPIKIAWICGPSGFNRYYSDLLIQSGLASEKIIMM